MCYLFTSGVPANYQVRVAGSRDVWCCCSQTVFTRITKVTKHWKLQRSLVNYRVRTCNSLELLIMMTHITQLFTNHVPIRFLRLEVTSRSRTSNLIADLALAPHVLALPQFGTLSVRLVSSAVVCGSCFFASIVWMTSVIHGHGLSLNQRCRHSKHTHIAMYVLTPINR